MVVERLRTFFMLPINSGIQIFNFERFLRHAVKRTGGSLGGEPTDLLQLAGLSFGPLQFLMGRARELRSTSISCTFFGTGPSRNACNKSSASCKSGSRDVVPPPNILSFIFFGTTLESPPLFVPAT